MLLAFAPPVQALTIDGDLGDWGVTPFSDFTPDPPAVIVTDDHPDGDYPNGGELFDIEALLLRGGDRLAFALVTSFPEAGAEIRGRHVVAGDLLIDTDPDDGFLGDFGVILAGDDKGDIYYRPAWHLPQGEIGLAANGPSNVDAGESDPPIGQADVAWHNYGDVEGYGSDTWGVEVELDWSVVGLAPGDIRIFAHHTMGCGNDVVELEGVMLAPEPATIALLAIGGLAGLVGRLQRRRSRP
jgi:hypothetical protein